MVYNSTFREDMENFIHLHTHSYYSFLDGVISPEELIDLAVKNGMKALALTDHNGLYGAVEFYIKAIKNITNDEVDGYICYLLQNEIRIVKI